MSTLEACEKLFGTRDVYKLLELPKDAAMKDIKKAYYKLSLQIHPDRVSESEKAAATEKFKVLSRIYQVLSDKDKRELYNEQGIIDEDDDNGGGSNIRNLLDLWRQVFKPLSTEDIENYQKNYQGSELERTDIRKAYLSGKGCINHMMNEVPFLRVEDEPRLQEIVRELIAADEVPEYTIFTKEPAQKRNRRHKKYGREAREAEEIKQKLFAKNSSSGTLEQQIMERQRSRESNYNSLMDKLLEKYGDEDETDVIDFDDLDKSSKKRKRIAKKRPSKGQKQTSNSASKLKHVKEGRIKKGKN